ncbi:MAG: polysaccharide deacetylase family protein [Gemmatimonadetes bacterium]|nr:polysaccharide deacetylase family protein [Gemmatimonadota bacterium]
MSQDLSLLVTVDTEGDDEWVFRRTPASENVGHMQPFEDALGRLGIRATYLVTHSVAVDEAAAEILRGYHEDRGAEIGAHCHAWNTPPVAEPEGAQLFLNELSDAAQRAKLETLTEVIVEKLGVQPKSFRGGRFGANVATMRALTELGYEVDSSVTPGVSWRRTLGVPGGEGGPDYRRAPLHTYYQDPADPCRPGNGPLFEIPVTVVRSRRLPRLAEHAIAAQGPASFASAVVGKLGLGRMMWFYAAFQTTEELVTAAELTAARGGDVLNMMLHSSELMPGGSPYFKTREDVSGFIGRMEQSLEQVLEKTGAVPRTLAEVPRPPRQEEAPC